MLLRGRKNQKKPAVRWFFATDVHGSDVCFRKFLAGAEVYSAQVLVLGGDVVGKAIVPLVANGGGRTRVVFHGQTREVDAAELPAVMDQIQFNGLYPWPCEQEGFERLAEDHAFRGTVFDQLIGAQISAWCDLAAERLGPDVRCIITPGNDDPEVVDEVLRRAERIECPEREVVEVGPLLLASLGNTNRTPWDTDREYDEDELTQQIGEMLEPCEGDRPSVFNFHCPPYGSGLDTVVKLDADFRPVIDKGAPVEIPVGSTAVRDAIVKYQPTVGLHGHVHEQTAVRRIGSTTCLNPGSEYSTGMLKGALVDFAEDGTYLNHLFTSG
jgi:uncharacterized protein